MTAKTSQQMLDARELIKKGATPYRAAKDCGLTVSAITRSPWYKEFTASKPAAAVEPSAMHKAQALVEGGKTAYEAAKLAGVAQSSISRSPWYNAFRKNNDSDTN